MLLTLCEVISLPKPEKEVYKAKEVLPNFFRLRIPLPIPALGYLNSYLIKGEDRCLLIDVGMDSDEGFSELNRQLIEIGIKPQNLTEILVTHFHIDHVGLVSQLRKLSGAQLIISAREVEAVQMILQTYESHWKDLTNFYKGAGVPAELVEQMLNATPSRLYQSVYRGLAKPSRTLEDGEEMTIGEYTFQAVWTPGHSPGHICLYEPQRRLLIAGDHILPTITPHITPHITQWGEEANFLAQYLQSLDKVRKLNVDIVFPGHEEVFKNHRKRIDELREHHRLRAMEILSKLQIEELTAYQIASRIRWNVKYPSWDKLPIFQKFLALGETLAHLRFLEEENRVKKRKRAEITFYHTV